MTKEKAETHPGSVGEAEFLGFIKSTHKAPRSGKAAMRRLDEIAWQAKQWIERIRGYKCLDTALAVVAPGAERRVDFIREYDVAVRRILDFTPMAKWPAPSEREAAAARFADDVKALLKHFDRLPQPLKHWIVKGSRFGRPADIEGLAAMSREARFHATAPDKGKGAPPQSQAREEAARQAQRLLVVFTAGKRPVGPGDTRFLSLASLLYQEATGAKDADLKPYCRNVFEVRTAVK